MKFTAKKKAAALIGAGAIAVAGSGVAFAYWTTTGTGSNSDASSASPATVTYVADFDAASLAPGTSVPVDYSVTNDSDTDLQVAGVTAAVSSSVSACDAYLSLSAQPDDSATVVPNNDSVDLGSATIDFANSADNQNVCQNQTITVTFTDAS